MVSGCAYPKCGLVHGSTARRRRVGRDAGGYDAVLSQKAAKKDLKKAKRELGI